MNHPVIVVTEMVLLLPAVKVAPFNVLFTYNEYVVAPLTAGKFKVNPEL